MTQRDLFAVQPEQLAELRRDLQAMPDPMVEDGRYDHDRCCCECGTHFDGTLEDDYCPSCFDKLPEEVFHER